MEVVQHTSLSIPSLFGRLLRRVNPWQEGKCKNGAMEKFVGIWRPDSRRSEADRDRDQWNKEVLYTMVRAQKLMHTTDVGIGGVRG